MTIIITIMTTIRGIPTATDILTGIPIPAKGVTIRTEGISARSPG